MNELAVRQVDLPALPAEEIKVYVDMIGDAIDALKAKRNAAGHLNVDKAVVDEMDAQIREYSAMKLRAEMELGKKTAAIPKAQGVKSDFRQGVAEVPKEKALGKMGISHQRASDMERMAKHEEVVNRYIDHQLSIGETPTRAGAFQKIAQTAPKPKTAKQAAQEKIESIKSSPVVSIQDAVVVREEQKVIDFETRSEVERRIHKAESEIYHLCTTGSKDFQTYASTAGKDEIRETIRYLNQFSGYILKLRSILEANL